MNGVANGNRAGWRLECSYAVLPAGLWTAVGPTPVRAPRLVVMNEALAGELGLDAAELATEAGVAWLAGKALPPGARPIAQAYSGHQYGHFTTLGDGRAILLGEQVTPTGGRWDVQLKGSGPTPYARRGDGRAALGPMLREYVISEAMHALGIPTTRSLAVVATGEAVRRETMRPGAVLIRVAASHLRVGTFEGAAAMGAGGAGEGGAELRALVEYAWARHYAGEGEGGARALLAAVTERQAALMAQWMAVGFVHGVMNTDNMAIAGETIDYGPCAFMEAYDPATVFSSIDRHGRYAYGNQPRVAQWNLARLAEALLPLLGVDREGSVAAANAELAKFGASYERHWLAGMRRKLGMIDAEAEDAELVKDLLAWMQEARADYTNTWALLAREQRPGKREAEGLPAEWLGRWAARLTRQDATVEEAARLREASCPAVIPRNHLVESALVAAEAGEMVEVERLVEVLRAPYDHERWAGSVYRDPAPAGAEAYVTYCGT